MRESSVLIVGMQGLAAEVAKNLVLAGVGSLRLLDGATVSPADLSANFLLRAEDVGRNRAEACVAQLQELNPNVGVSAQANSAEDMLQSDPQLFTRHRAVVLIGQAIDTQAKVSALLREKGASATADAAASSTVAPAASAAPYPAFFSGECLGLSGWFFEDLVQHSYTEARKLKDAATGQETEEEAIVAGEAKYERTVGQLFGHGEGATTTSHAELAKKFGRRAQEKHAAQQWMALRTLMQWRERQWQAAQAADSSATVQRCIPSLATDPAALTSLLTLRSEAAAASGIATTDVERVLPESLLLSLGRTLGLELPHVCAIVGGILGQEILKVISGKDKPLANTFIYNATVRTRNTHKTWTDDVALRRS